MERSTKAHGYKLIVASALLSFMSAVAMAQDTATTSSSHTTVTTTETTWYAEPWAWALGAAILIIIIIALTRGGGSSKNGGTVDKVTYSKKVEREDNA